jgi:lysophospholipase L1-like esterase
VKSENSHGKFTRITREGNNQPTLDTPVLRDPQVPSQLLKQYDIGDHLHPSVAGYQALADYPQHPIKVQYRIKYATLPDKFINLLTSLLPLGT